jgi:hypothetical protein
VLEALNALSADSRDGSITTEPDSNAPPPHVRSESTVGAALLLLAGCFKDLVLGTWLGRTCPLRSVSRKEADEEPAG